MLGKSNTEMIKLDPIRIYQSLALAPNNCLKRLFSPVVFLPESASLSPLLAGLVFLKEFSFFFSCIFIVKTCSCHGLFLLLWPFVLMLFAFHVFIGVYDFLDQWMTDDVFPGKIDEFYALDTFQDLFCLNQP